MPTVSLTIPAQAEHVRTARLVATAAARRCGLTEDSVDDVRLAVGEACTLAVVRTQTSDSKHEILIELTDEASHFGVTVNDRGGIAASADDDQLALALITALVPQSSIESKGAVCTITMVWPTTAN